MNIDQSKILNSRVAVIILLALLLGGGYYLINKNSNDNQKRIGTTSNGLQDEQQKEIDSLKEEVEKLKSQKPQTTVKEVDRPSTKPSLTSIINQWRPRIAYIECAWWGSNGVNTESSGSGVLGPKTSDGRYFLLTNKHVVSNERSNPATQCHVWLPDISSPYIITADLERMMMEEISFDPNYDYGNIIINRPTQQIIFIANNSKYTVCERRANVGEQVLIMGYPGIGSASDITVTEGIISGYEDGYYITSAKVEKGNSGGAAILVEDNCYLGIPSFAYSGQLESLARILDLNLI
jgi:S1-C subfamily serine protease